MWEQVQSRAKLLVYLVRNNMPKPVVEKVIEHMNSMSWEDEKVLTKLFLSQSEITEETVYSLMEHKESDDYEVS